jgi:hypothetical protein
MPNYYSPLPLTNLSSSLHFPLLRYPHPPIHLECARLRQRAKAGEELKLENGEASRLRHSPALALGLSQHRHICTSALALSADTFAHLLSHICTSALALSAIDNTHLWIRYGSLPVFMMDTGPRWWGDESRSYLNGITIFLPSI